MCIIKLSSDDYDSAKPMQFGDSACTCKTCNHTTAADCIKSNCNCCTDANHSMVLDGIEGFRSSPSIPK